MDTVYDFTRLFTRFLNDTPNGIDRVDFALAQHFLAKGKDSFGILGMPVPRLHPGACGAAAITSIAAHWGETIEPEKDAGYLQVVKALSQRADHAPASLPHSGPPRISLGRRARLQRLLNLVTQSKLGLGRSPKRNVPAHARYINVSQFPLWMSKYFDWLSSRRDVRPVFFIHDLLPLSMPEYFRSGEFNRHRLRIANLARFGSGAIVASTHVREELADALRTQGRTDFPIAALPIPVSPVFSAPRVHDPRLAHRPYFVCCGTIEPRKNHLLLLNIWRELVQRHGSAAPFLVLVGARGWHYDAIADILERSVTLRSHVVEISGLSTPSLKRLLDNACALLMPTFAEGYGLPVREALEAGLPVVASDIPAFRQEKRAGLRLLNPLDGSGWLAAIEGLMGEKRQIESDHLKIEPADQRWRQYFSEVEDFIGVL